MSSLIYPALLIIAFFIPLNEGITYVGALLLLIAFLGGAIKPRRTIFDIPLIILIVLIGLTIVFSVDFLASLRAFSFLCLCIMLFYYFPMWSEIPEKNQRHIHLAIDFSCFFVSFIGILQFYRGPNFLSLYHNSVHQFGARLRVFSTLFNPDVLGGYLVFVLPVNIALSLAAEKFWQKVVGATSFLLGAICLYLTFSRGSWLGFLSGIVVLMLLLREKKLIISLFSFLLIGFLFFPHFISERLINSIFLLDSQRVILWGETIKLIYKKPVFGFGLFTFQKVMSEITSLTSFPHAHNIFLHIIFEMGTVGLFAFLYLFWIIYRRALEYIRQYKNRYDGKIAAGVLSGLSAFLVSEQFNINLILNNITILFFFCLSVLGMLIQYSVKNKGI